MKKVVGFRPDEMTSKERMAALFAGKPIDRVPFYLPLGTGFCGKNAGFSKTDVYSDPQKSADAQMWTMEQYGFEVELNLSYAAYGAWEFGGEIRFPAGEFEQAPKVIRYPAQTEEDVWNLKLPDVNTAGILPRLMQFSRICKERGLSIPVSCGTPFTRAGNLCGVEKMCRWIMKKPAVVHRLLRLATDHCVQVAQLWAKTFGAENCSPKEGAPTEANQVISPKQFEQFALPYLVELHEKVFAMGIKRFGNVHICGEQNLNLPLWTKVPMGDNSILHFGHEVEIDTAIKYFGDTSIIAGNINPSIIMTGTPQQVYELCRQAIEKGKRAPKGFLLTAGCELPGMAPPYNVYVMRKAVNDFGWYD